MKVSFEAGTGRHFAGGVNFMQTEDGKLYAECQVPEGAAEDYGYCKLKLDMMLAACKSGIKPWALDFWYAGQDDSLSNDAKVNCKTYVEYDGQEV